MVQLAKRYHWHSTKITLIGSQRSNLKADRERKTETGRDRTEQQILSKLEGFGVQRQADRKYSNNRNKDGIY